MDADRPGDVAVVIAVRNGLPHIMEAVESASRQGAAAREVIVVDDGSEDGTFEQLAALAEPRLRIVRNEGHGVSTARNVGASLANAPWLLFLDADDRLAPGALDALLAALTPGAVAAYGDYERIDTKGRLVGNRHLIRRRRKKPRGAVLTSLVAGNFIINGGILICSRAIFLSVGGFSSRLALGEDWHLWCKLATEGHFDYLATWVLDYRVHGSSVMMATRRRFEDFQPVLDAIFTDRSITDGLEADQVPRLRKRAELNAMTYCAQQAIRAHNLEEGIKMTAAALKHVPGRAPWVLGRVVGSWVNI